MKNVLTFLVACALAAPLSAQGFLGKLAKKVLKETVSAPAASSAGRVTMVDGVAMPPLLASHVKLRVVSCEGDPVMGQVKMVVQAVANDDVQLTLAGGSSDKVSAAFDATGSKFALQQFDRSTRDNMQLTSGVPLNYELSILKVPAGLAALKAVTLSFSLYNKDYQQNTGMADVSPIRFSDVPITWTTAPTSNIVGWPMQAQKHCQLRVASCVGEKASGRVRLTIAVLPNDADVNISVGNAEGCKAFDAAGNTYEGKADGKFYVNCDRQLTPDVPSQFKFLFSGIPTSMKEFSAVRSEFSIHNRTRDLIINTGMFDVPQLVIKQVPIEWK